MLNLLIGPLTTLIERIFPDKAEQDRAKSEMMVILAEAEAKQAEAKSKVIIAEARGESWLQRNWRPLTMLFFLVLLGSYWFGFAPEYLINSPAIVDKLFTLLEIGIGGYIIGRSVEKTATKISTKQLFEALRREKGHLTQKDVDDVNRILKGK